MFPFENTPYYSIFLFLTKVTPLHWQAVWFIIKKAMENFTDLFKKVFDTSFGKRIRFYIHAWRIVLQLTQILVLLLIFCVIANILITKKFHDFLTPQFWLTMFFSIFSVFVLGNVYKLSYTSKDESFQKQTKIFSKVVFVLVVGPIIAAIICFAIYVFVFFLSGPGVFPKI